MNHNTTVVCLKRTKDKIIQDCDIYIGRQCNMGGWKLPKSKWANPYTLKEYGSAEEVCKKYKEYILNKPELLKDLHELVGKRLGCWCKGKHMCHGDILVELIDKL